jgi:DNA or RNA helicases of superfamily II
VRLRFDHGTVLLEGVPREVDVRGGPDLHWDPRVSCWRAPAAEAPEIAARLSTRYGPLLRDDSSPWRTHPSPDLGRLTQIPAALRPYQQAALWAWTQSGRRGVVVLPTGAGKTWVALAAIATTQVPSLVCVPTRVLMHQWRAQLEAHLSPAQVGCWGDGRFVTRGVTVATFESAYRHLGRHGDRFGLLVLDEVHHFAGPGQTRRALLEMSVAPYASGSPPRRRERLPRTAQERHPRRRPQWRRRPCWRTWWAPWSSGRRCMSSPAATWRPFPGSPCSWI